MNARLALHPAVLLSTRYLACHRGLQALLLLPALWMLLEAWANRPGPALMEALIRDSGRWAIVCLAGFLAVTPLRFLLVRASVRVGLPAGRRLEDWNPLIHLRPTIGVFAFGYVVLHVCLHLGAHLGPDAGALGQMRAGRLALISGGVAFAALLPLAFASLGDPGRTPLRLRRLWRRIAYAAAVAACLHGALVARPDPFGLDPAVVVIALLLLHRMVVFLRPVGDATRDGADEVPERRQSRRRALRAAPERTPVPRAAVRAGVR